MFKKLQILKGVTVNLVEWLFKQSSRVKMFFFLLFLQNESSRIALTFYGISFKITNLDLF